MKTLKESILGSTKTGKAAFAIDPESIKKSDDAIKYIKYLYGNKVEDFKSFENLPVSKAVKINYNNKLSLIIDFYYDYAYIYTFVDKNNNTLYTGSSCEVERTNWEEFLNINEWCNTILSRLNKLIKKEESASYRHYNNYSRTHNSASYNKYLSSSRQAETYKAKYDKIEKIQKLL